MTDGASLQTKLACSTLILIIANICVLMAIIAIWSKIELCKIMKEEKLKFKERKLELNHLHRPLLSDLTDFNQEWFLSFLIIPDNILIGGASIISKNWVLTSAFCFQESSNWPLSKQVFQTNVTKLFQNEYYHYINMYIIHEKFNLSLNDYDIALAKVKNPFDNNQVVVSLFNEQLKFRIAVITSWSSQHDKYKQADLINLKVILQENCTVLSNYSLHISPRPFCGVNVGEPSYNFLHPGGAVTQHNELLGIISYKSCNSRKQFIFSNVTAYRKWITDIVKIN